MTHEEHTNLYYADEGKLFVRIADGFVMGNCIDLGRADLISNYAEVAIGEVDSFVAQIDAMQSDVEDVNDESEYEEGDVL